MTAVVENRYPSSAMVWLRRHLSVSLVAICVGGFAPVLVPRCGVCCSAKTGAQRMPTASTPTASTDAPSTDAGKNDRARAVLQQASDQLVQADDGAAVRTLANGLGDLLESDLGHVAAEFDARTRQLALDFVEEFAAEFAELGEKRKKLLGEIVQMIKSSPAKALDERLARFRDRIVETGVLDLVDAEIEKLSKEGRVTDFMIGLRDRLRLEVATAYFGEAAIALKLILAEPNDTARCAALATELRRQPARRDALRVTIQETRAEVDEADAAAIPDRTRLLATLDRLLAGCDAHVVDDEEVLP